MATFEEQLAELEKVVERLERGDLPLEDNVTLFERGIQLSNACKQQLSAAESRVQVLLDPEGDPRVENLALAVADDEEDEDQFIADEEE
jgi:exodeoxyribonuclease VII small subunit